MTAPCIKCGAPGKLIEVIMGDKVIISHFSCQPCFDNAFAELEENRRQFNELIAAGVSREEANKIMCARINEEAVQ